jgi:predicted CxxxxCH...CXXCH cytochrome family protein
LLRQAASRCANPLCHALIQGLKTSVAQPNPSWTIAEC